MAINGLQWPCLMYDHLKCNPEDMWEGLLRSNILVQVSCGHGVQLGNRCGRLINVPGSVIFQGYKHIFTSPSSVDGQSRSTRCGNAQLHGMTAVTIPSIAYVTTLVSLTVTVPKSQCNGA